MSVQSISSYLLPIFLLAGSNVFMTTAWYWHLRYKEVPLISVIFISWGLAFVEYCMAVPASLRQFKRLSLSSSLRFFRLCISKIRSHGAKVLASC